MTTSECNAFYNQIIQGDCTTVLKTIPDSCVDLAVTDPPYLVNYHDRLGRKILNDDNPENVMSCFPELYRVMKYNSFCVCFYGWQSIDLFMTTWKRAGFTPVGHIVWHKSYASRTGYLKACHEQAYLLAKGRPRRYGDAINDVMPWEYSGNRWHPTEKSVSVLKPLIETFSRPGDLVIDPFAGSGSTAAAAAFTNRNYLCIELDPKYYEIASRRLAGVARYYDSRAAA